MGWDSLRKKTNVARNFFVVSEKIRQIQKGFVTPQGVPDLVFEKCHTAAIYYAWAELWVSQDFAGPKRKEPTFFHKLKRGFH